MKKERNRITIDEHGNPVVPTASGAITEIGMTETELAALFGVVVPIIWAAMKAAYKSGVLKECEVCKYVRLENGNGADVYNMEAVVSLAFRPNTRGAAVFRKWLIRRATAPTRAAAPIIIQYKEGFIC